MAGLNKIQIIGNLGGDPELRYLPDGRAVASFSVAVSRTWKGADGVNKEETDWFRVSAFDKLAEICNQYLSKGRQVYIEGRIRVRAYADQQGQPRCSADVTARDMVMLGSRDGAGGAPGRGMEPAEDDLENIPF